MELQRIVAKDTRTAAVMAAERYGRDALIVSNERVNGRVELIVAVEGQRSGKGLSDAHGGSPTAKHSGLLRTQAAVTAASEVNRHEGPKADAMMARALEDVPQPGRARELVEFVKSELAELRREIRLSQKIASSPAYASVDPELRHVLEALERAGVPAGVRVLLAETISSVRDEAAALVSIEKTLQSMLVDDCPLDDMHGIHAISGPTGSGKTLMVAKLARHHVVERGYMPEDIGIVCFGRHGPGAWGRQQTLASMTGVDCFLAKSPEALQEVLLDLASRKLVLIDLPGSSTADVRAQLLQCCPRAICHAVIPADAGVSTYRRFAQGEGGPCQTFMLTKSDEPSDPWSLLQALLESGIRISSSGNGPKLVDFRDGWSTRPCVQNMMQSIRDSLAQLRKAM